MNKLLIGGVCLLLLSGCGDSAYTLYRSSVVDGVGQVPVAAFNFNKGGDFNRESCEYTRQLYAAQPGISTHFWCTKH